MSKIKTIYTVIFIRLEVENTNRVTSFEGIRSFTTEAAAKEHSDKVARDMHALGLPLSGYFDILENDFEEEN